MDSRDENLQSHCRINNLNKLKLNSLFIQNIPMLNNNWSWATATLRWDKEEITLMPLPLSIDGALPMLPFSYLGQVCVHLKSQI